MVEMGKALDSETHRCCMNKHHLDMLWNFCLLRDLLGRLRSCITNNITSILLQRNAVI
jgi:hypothetical protein